MRTLYLSAADANTPKIAAEIIRSGGLVAIPTETVYGLGANGLDEKAVAKIFEAKGRPQDNPLILHVADPAQIEDFCHSIPESAYRLAEAFWPGPLTMVLPAKDIVPLSTRANLPSVAVRCPDCDVTRAIIRLAGVPVAAPSANISGKPSTTTADHVRHDHDGRIDAIVDGGACRVGVESTIIDLTDSTPRLLRPGGITTEELCSILGDIIIDKAVVSSVDKDAVVKAPGMKYRHYAPQCRVLVVKGSVNVAAGYVREHWQPGDRVLCFEEELDAFAPFNPLAYGKKADTDTLLAGLFAALRELDDPKIGTVFARCPTGNGKALAVQNRLLKAAGFCSVDPTPKGLVLGITGGSGSGKTTLLKVFKEAGGYTVDCDDVYHRLLQYNAALHQKIGERFPGTIVDGQLDRKALGAIVFADPNALADLNAITHPVVKERIGQLMKVPNGVHVAIDAIGLFEGGLAQMCDVTVAVTAPAEDRVARLTQRDGITAEYARKRIAAQHSDDWFRENCTYTLENDSTQEAFQAKCLAFLNQFGIIRA